MNSTKNIIYQESISGSEANAAFLELLEAAKLALSKAEQRYFTAQAICCDLYKNSDPYKVQRIRQWDNRGKDDV